MAPGAKDRLVVATIALVRERGVHGTGLADVLERSGAARGSIYQHFPGGKSALVVEAVRTAGRHLVAIARRAGEDAPDAPAVAMVDALLDWWTDELRRHGGTRGCPIAAAAVDADPAVNAAALEVFDDLRSLLATSIDDPAQAGFVLSALEGAILRARVSGDPQALDEVRSQVRTMWGASPRT